MRKEFNNIVINRIQFESNNDDVILFAEVQEGMLRFPIRFIISHAELNQLLGLYLAYNPLFNYEDCLEVVQVNENLIIYTLDFPQTIQNPKSEDILPILSSQEILQIRA